MFLIDNKAKEVHTYIAARGLRSKRRACEEGILNQEDPHDAVTTPGLETSNLSLRWRKHTTTVVVPHTYYGPTATLRQ